MRLKDETPNRTIQIGYFKLAECVYFTYQVNVKSIVEEILIYWCETCFSFYDSNQNWLHRYRFRYGMIPMQVLDWWLCCFHLKVARLQSQHWTQKSWRICFLIDLKKLSFWHNVANSLWDVTYFSDSALPPMIIVWSPTDRDPWLYLPLFKLSSWRHWLSLNSATTRFV